MSILLYHGRVRLMLHELRGGMGRPLLLLHGLGERSPAGVPGEAARWPGPVFALDFTGHGESSIPHGGGYTPEILVGDVDAALGLIGEATLAGRGLGAYVALLTAGARPHAVRGAVLADGPGLAGGDGIPDPAQLSATYTALGTPDPLALADLGCDLRPAEFALRFVHLASEKSGLPQPLVVAAAERPPWLAAVAAEPGVVMASVEAGLSLYAGGS